MVTNPWISDLHWVREGQQTRSQRTQERLLDAAEALFADQGADATSVADVAERAGCSVGAVYHHFRDKKALLYAIYNRMSEQYESLTRDALSPARWEGASIRDLINGFLEFSIESGRNKPSFKRAGIEATRSEPELQKHFAELRLEMERGMMKLFLARIEEIGHPDPVLATAFILQQLSAMTASRLDENGYDTQLKSYSDEEFIEEMLRSATSYLKLKPVETLVASK